MTAATQLGYETSLEISERLSHNRPYIEAGTMLAEPPISVPVQLSYGSNCADCFCYQAAEEWWYVIPGEGRYRCRDCADNAGEGGL